MPMGQIAFAIAMKQADNAVRIFQRRGHRLFALAPDIDAHQLTLPNKP